MRFRIRAYLVMAFLLTSGLPLAVFWLWPHSAALQSQVDEVHERHLLIAKNLSSTLQVYHRDLTTAFGSFAPQISRGQAIEAKGIFEALHFRHICVASPDTGEVIHEYFGSQHACPKTIPNDRLQYFLSLAPTNGIGVSRVIAPESEQPRIFLVTRENGLLIVGAIHTTYFRSLQADISFGERGHAAIVDRSGHILAHPNAEWTNRAADLSDISVVQRIMAGETGVANFFSPAMQVEMIAGFAFAEGTGWGVMVPQPVNELQAFADHINKYALLVLIAGLLFSWLMALIISSGIARRVRRIEEAVTAVADGKTIQPVVSGKSIASIREFENLEQGVARTAAEIAGAKAAEAKNSEDLSNANARLRSEINEKLRAESALVESEKRFKSLFESQPISVREEDFSKVKKALHSLPVNNASELSMYFKKHPEFVQECASRIVVRDANQKALELHGCIDKPAFRQSVTSNLSGSAQSALKKIFLAVFSGERLVEYESKIVRATGEERTVMARWSVVSGYEETYERIILTSIDITDYLEAEERLRQAQKMEAIGQLTGGVAHDFNNLLAVILGNQEMLRDQVQSTSLNVPISLGLINRTVEATNRGAELTQNMLAYARKAQLVPERVDLNQVVKETENWVGRTIESRIEIDTIQHAGLWPTMVDRASLQSALVNLLLNARDGIDGSGQVIIETSNVRIGADYAKDRDKDVPPGRYVLLSVSDNGSGIEPDILDQIFDPFFTTKTVGKGSGLGLSMVQGFVKQSGGVIRVNSAPDSGTTIRIYFPAAVATSPERNELKNDEPVPVASERSGKRLLLVEDQEDVLTVMEKTLITGGFEVVTADSGDRAFEILRGDDQFDLVVTDIVMPGRLQGPSLARETRALHPAIPFIFVSGYASESMVQDENLKPDDVRLMKPVSRKTLLKAVKTAISNPR